MALVVVSDVEARLGRSLTSTELTRADPGLLDEASALVLAYLGWDEVPMDPVDPLVPLAIPSAVYIVASRMVARVIEQAAASVSPVGAESVTQSAGPFSQAYQFGSGSASGSPWLTAGDKVLLKRYRANGGQVSVPMSAGQTGLYRRVIR